MGGRWKLVGLAGLAGVAATGAVVARRRRDSVEVTPDELRDRLRERLADAGADAGAGAAGGEPVDVAANGAGV